MGTQTDILYKQIKWTYENLTDSDLIALIKLSDMMIKEYEENEQTAEIIDKINTHKGHIHFATEVLKERGIKVE